MIPHGELYDTAVPDQVLTTLQPVITNGDITKTLPNPRCFQVEVFSQDVQYGTFHQAEAFPGIPDPAVYIRPHSATGEDLYGKQPYFMPAPFNLVSTARSYLKAFHSAGAPQDITGIVSMLYDKQGTESRDLMSLRGYPRGIFTQKGANLSADQWTEVNTFDGQIGVRYAIIGAQAYGANAAAVRFDHPEFGGLYPMLRAFDDWTYGTQWFKYCPVFTGGDPLIIEGYTRAAEDMEIILQMVQLP